MWVISELEPTLYKDVYVNGLSMECLDGKRDS